MGDMRRTTTLDTQRHLRPPPTPQHSSCRAPWRPTRRSRVLGVGVMVLLLAAAVSPAFAQVSYLGSFAVNDGPEPPSIFQPNNAVPQVYSCVEACQVKRLPLTPSSLNGEYRPGGRVHTNTPSRVAPSVGHHQLHPQGSSTYLLTYLSPPHVFR